MIIRIYPYDNVDIHIYIENLILSIIYKKKLFSIKMIISIRSNLIHLKIINICFYKIFLHVKEIKKKNDCLCTF